MKLFLRRVMSALSPLLSRRLMMTILAMYLLRNSFWGMVHGMYSFTRDTELSVYQSLCIAYFSAVVGVVMWYIGNTTWKGGLSVAANLQSMMSASSVVEKLEHIVIEGEGAAPARKPYAQEAGDEA